MVNPKSLENLKRGNTGHGSTEKPEVKALKDALLKVANEKEGMTILEHAVRKAYEDNSVLIALIKKLVPDLNSLEVSEVKEVVVNIIKKYAKDDRPGTKPEADRST